MSEFFFWFCARFKKHSLLLLINRIGDCMFKESKDTVLGSLEAFYDNDVPASYWGENLDGMKTISSQIVNKIYSEKQPSKLYKHRCDCIVRGIVYMSNEILSKKDITEFMSFKKFGERFPGCSYTSVQTVSGLVEIKIGDTSNWYDMLLK